MPGVHRPPSRNVRFDGDERQRQRRAQGAGAPHRRPGQRRALRRAQLCRLRLLPRGGEGLQDDRTGNYIISITYHRARLNINFNYDGVSVLTSLYSVGE